ncbi:MAG: DUF2917 domain-containing protein [Burkholderiaceae bacterium]|nr:DUF2917 domain-containing protein [Burkholderiaceae bacterium]
MVTRNIQKLQQLQASKAASVFVCWTLMPGRAISLRPHEAGLLRIARGQVWATLDGSPAWPGSDLGDHFLQAGQQLAVRAGQHLVMEPHGAALEAPVYFEWTPLDEPVAASRWQGAVIRPLRELGQALRVAARALGRLVLGLAGYGEYLVAGRGRVMPRLEANQP